MNKLMKGFSRGASALPVVLLISGIILEVVVAGLAVAQFFSNSSAAEQLSIGALEAAESGASDAILRVTSYINCPDTDYCPSSYSLSVGTYSACVNIGSISGGEMTIHSKGIAFTRERTIEAVLEVSTSTARVNVNSFKEVETPESFTSCSG